MRLAAQMKLGFYPAAREAIEPLLTQLVRKPWNPNAPKQTVNILDPCAGEGLALRQIREGLEVNPENTYAIELDARRVESIRSNNPGINLVGPASFLNVQITNQSFGLAYVNPPFDDELGGGKREEQAFAERAMRMLCPRGILVLVCPLKALVGNVRFVEFLDGNFEESALYKFPDGDTAEGKPIRPYNEVVFIGRKRIEAIPTEESEKHGKLHQMQMQWRYYITMDSLPVLGTRQPYSFHNGSPSYDKEDQKRVWEIPACLRPHCFKKTMFTDEELAEAVESSPLNAHLTEFIVPPPVSPPLPLGNGHLGLILASGMLDGVVEGPHGNHVVRGSSHKVSYHNEEASESTKNPETGAVTTKDVISERMVTVIRTVEADGNMQTFSNEAAKKVAKAEGAGRGTTGGMEGENDDDDENGMMDDGGDDEGVRRFDKSYAG